MHLMADVYTPTPDDVYAVRNDLRLRVPTEIADLILEEAEYWPKFSSQFEPTLDLWVTDDGTKCCALSPALQMTTDADADARMKIRKIHFQIQSHDQGWSSEPAGEGPYDHSWTWFEGLILREFRDDIDDMEEIKEMLETRCSVQPETSHLTSDGVVVRKMQSRTLVTVKDPNSISDSWTIQRNRFASATMETHNIIWRREAGDGDEAKYWAKGSSLGVDFINSIQTGDRIAVLARAMFPGWANCARSVYIDIFFSV